jgi:lipopolysaccharide cholinephosphotransferase
MINLKLAVPDSFYVEEEISGYYVSRKMKEVWAVELDLLSEFQRVCKKHNLTYFADAGTLIGAIRHKGFIPWDDDIDVIMMREDYEKLCQVAETEFKHPYFFQTEYTDPTSNRGHAQLRNSNTTGILQSEYGKKFFNQGIFIDIFPYDAVTEDKTRLKVQKRHININKKLSRKISNLTKGFKVSNYDSNVKKIVYSFVHTILDNKFFNVLNKYELVSISKISGLIIENNIFSLLKTALFKNTNISSLLVS